MLMKLAGIRSVSRILTKRTMSTHFYSGNDGRKLDHEHFMNRVGQHCAQDKKCLVLVGENHADQSAHSLELGILERVHSAMKSFDTSNSLALSLEFYDREAQTVLNEYLKGIQ